MQYLRIHEVDDVDLFAILAKLLGIEIRFIGMVNFTNPQVNNPLA